MVFVVPDNMVDKATQALLASNTKLSFTAELCADNDSCSRKQEGPLPTQHLHSKTPGVVSSADPDFSIKLFAQSTVLWTLPPIDSSLLPTDSVDEAEFAKTIGPTYLVASDSAVLPGIHSAGQHPVVVPRPDVQLDVYFRMLARSLREEAGKDLVISLYSDVARLVRHIHRLGYLDAENLSPTASELFHKYKDITLRRGDWEKALLEVF